MSENLQKTIFGSRRSFNFNQIKAIMKDEGFNAHEMIRTRLQIEILTLICSPVLPDEYSIS